MNEETAKLIRELADKLGTTADHLWSVLVRQAPISGACDAVCSVVGIVMIVLAWVFVRSRYKAETDDAELVAFIAFIWTVFLTVAVVIEMPLTLAAFFNPEYWALKQIIK